MKPIFLVTLFLFLVFSAKSQIVKGAFMAEGGVNLVGNSSYDVNSFTEGFGFWHFDRDRFNQFPGHETTFSYGMRTTGLSIGPKIGYSFAPNLVGGIDCKYKWNRLSSASSDDYPDRFRTGQFGIFVRKYFGHHALSPFIEGGLGSGTTHVAYWSTSPGGGHYKVSYKRDLFYTYGAGGISYSVKPKFCINLYVKAQHTKDSPVNTSNYSTSENKILDTNVALVLSFSYFLKPKSK